jgi:diketogulonate reductase-like aldo/keto reductase
MTPDRASFPNAHLEISRIGFGCASLMRITSTRARERLLACAFEHGVRHFDLARMYGLGAAEAEVGRFARHHRDEVTIATKFGIDPAAGLRSLARFQQPVRAVLNRVPAARRAVKRRAEVFSAPRCYDAIGARRSFDRSLQELRLDYVDILFVHDPAPADAVRTDELLEFFEEMHSTGKLKSWGVSQDAHPGLNVIDGLGPSAVLQVRQTAFDQAEHDVPTITFGVLGAPRQRILHALRADAGLRDRWREALHEDPTEGDSLARLLLGNALATNPSGAVLFSTVRAERLAVAAQVLADPPSAETLAVFRALVARDVPATAA